MFEWEILDSGVQSAEANMRKDAELLEKVHTFAKPILHLYEWEGESATYGYFTDPSEFLDMGRAQNLNLHLARRPTGGGIVFHLWDMAFSVVVPSHCPEFSANTLENYVFINRAVLAAAREFLNRPLSLTPEDFSAWDPNCSHFCMAKPTKYDVVWEGRKIAGAAQRKTKLGFLHQGTIALVMPPSAYLEEILLPGTKVKEAMQTYTCPLLGRTASQEQIQLAKQQLRSLLTTHLRSASLSLTKQEV